MQPIEAPGGSLKLAIALRARVTPFLARDPGQIATPHRCFLVGHRSPRPCSADLHIRGTASRGIRNCCLRSGRTFSRYSSASAPPWRRPLPGFPAAALASPCQLPWPLASPLPCRHSPRRLLAAALPAALPLARRLPSRFPCRRLRACLLHLPLRLIRAPSSLGAHQSAVALEHPYLVTVDVLNPIRSPLLVVGLNSITLD